MKNRSRCICQPENNLLPSVKSCFCSLTTARSTTPRHFSGNCSRASKRALARSSTVSFPHVRRDLVDQIVLGVGRSKPGIPFGEGGPANLIFVVGVPRHLVNDYLICVGTLARLLTDESIRAALMRTKTPALFVDILRNAELP